MIFGVSKVSKPMQESMKNQCKNQALEMYAKMTSKSSKMNSKWMHKSSKRLPRGVPGDPSRPGDDQKASKRPPRGARLDLLVFYEVSRRPQSPGGMHRGALITYRLGRLTKQ